MCRCPVHVGVDELQSMLFEELEEFGFKLHLQVVVLNILVFASAHSNNQ